MLDARAHGGLAALLAEDRRRRSVQERLIPPRAVGCSGDTAESAPVLSRGPSLQDSTAPRDDPKIPRKRGFSKRPNWTLITLSLQLRRVNFIPRAIEIPPCLPRSFSAIALMLISPPALTIIVPTLSPNIASTSHMQFSQAEGQTGAAPIGHCQQWKIP